MVSLNRLRHCAECGAETANHSLICDRCAPDYADMPLMGDGGSVNLLTFETMLDGQVTETAAQAYSRAVDLAEQVLHGAPWRPEDAAEPMHDALARFTALTGAGLLKVIS